MSDDIGEQQEICTLAQGEFSGERARLSRKARDHTVEAVEDLGILVLYGDIAETALESSPSLAVEIGNVIEPRDSDLREVRLSKSSPLAR